MVFVHGDGPVDATHETFYRPVWEAFAKAGVRVTLLGQAGGEWGHRAIGSTRAMDDRAAETEAAIEWARGRSDIDPSRIGLWGASQAGWVMPKVVNLDPDVAFVIAVGPRDQLAPTRRIQHPSRTFREKCVGRRVRESAGRSVRRTWISWPVMHRSTISWPSGEADGLTEDPVELHPKETTSRMREPISKTVKVPVLLIIGGQDVNGRRG